MWKFAAVIRWALLAGLLAAAPAHARRRQLQQPLARSDQHATRGRVLLQSDTFQARTPPDGQYEVVWDTASLLELLQLRNTNSLIRLRDGFQLTECSSLTVGRSSNVAVDCQGATLDMRCGDSRFIVTDTANVDFYSCHFLWPLGGEFFNSLTDAMAFRVEFGAALRLHSGSSSLWCSALSDLPNAEAQGSYEVGAVNRINHWLVNMETTSGVVGFHAHRLFCLPPVLEPDTTETQFRAAVAGVVSVRLPNQNVAVSGVLRLASVRLWRSYRALLPGPTLITGVSSRAMIDLRRHTDLFAADSLSLDSVPPAPTYTRRLILQNLILVNLPQHSSNEAPLGTVTSLLWFADAVQPPPRSEEPLYTLQRVTAVVECGEVDFWLQYVQHVEQLFSGSLNSANPPLQADVQEEWLVLKRLSMLGIDANNYTITCESQPLVELMSFATPPTYSLDAAQRIAEDDARFWLNSKENNASFIGSWSQSRLIWVVATVLGGSALVLSLLLWVLWRSGFCGSKSMMVAKYMSENKDGNWRMRAPGLSSSLQPILSPMEVHDSPPNHMQANLASNVYRPSSVASYPRSALHYSNVPPSLPLEGSAADVSVRSSIPHLSNSGRFSITRDSHPQLPELHHHRESTEVLAASRSSSSIDDGATTSTPRQSANSRAGKHVATAATGPRLSPSQALQKVLESDVEDEHLEIDGIIGGGGFGTVYCGTWRGLQVAIKTVVFEVLDNDASGTQYEALQEAEIAYNLSHSNVVTTLSHELKRINTVPNGGVELACFKLYMIQEYCAGGSVANLMKQGHLRHRKGGLQLYRALRILKDVAAGMTYVHAKDIAHGNLSPSNILLQVPPSARGDEAQPFYNEVQSALLAAEAMDCMQCTAKISDFGLSVQFRQGVTHASNVKEGTPFYSAPELRQNCRLQSASDTYSFGVIMWEFFMGRPPYQVHEGRYTLDREFPTFPDYCPFNYAVLALACMSTTPGDRPGFGQVQTVLMTLEDELASGWYRDSTGNEREASEILATPENRRMCAEARMHSPRQRAREAPPPDAPPHAPPPQQRSIQAQPAARGRELSTSSESTSVGSFSFHMTPDSAGHQSARKWHTSQELWENSSDIGNGNPNGYVPHTHDVYKNVASPSASDNVANGTLPVV